MRVFFFICSLLELIKIHCRTWFKIRNGGNNCLFSYWRANPLECLRLDSLIICEPFVNELEYPLYSFLIYSLLLKKQESQGRPMVPPPAKYFDDVKREERFGRGGVSQTIIKTNISPTNERTIAWMVHNNF